MADLMDIGNDINESISRSYDVPEDVDEAELDAELEALGEEMEMGGWEAEGAGDQVPEFLRDDNEGRVPEFLKEDAEGGRKVGETA